MTNTIPLSFNVDISTLQSFKKHAYLFQLCSFDTLLYFRNKLYDEEEFEKYEIIDKLIGNIARNDIGFQLS